VKSRYLYLIAISVIVIDQLTKSVAVDYLPFEYAKPIVGNFIYLTTIHNRGCAFGVLQSWVGPLILVTLAVIVYILALSRRKAPISTLVGIALGLQLGGAIGNLIDRVRLRYVIDFIGVGMWPVFNIADVAITVGILLLAYHLLFCEGRAKENRTSGTTETTKE